MSGFLSSSIGKKFLMSITGLFLITFLAVHLTLNSFLMFDSSGELFNIAANFMATNWVMHVLEPILALGFIVHIIYALIVQIQNWSKRPVKYSQKDQKDTSKWSSRNMIYLGLFILIFLGLHIANFFWRIKFGVMPTVNYGGVEMHDTYKIVAGLFETSVAYDIFYIVGFISLGLHLNHALWSGLQTIGWSNTLWRKRWEVVGSIYAIIIAVGFSAIPIYFLIK